MSDCIFCDIVDGTAPARGVIEWPDAVAFRPLNPVANGHMLVVPRQHVSHAAEEPEITGQVMVRASQLAAEHFESFNIITSANHAATQTVYHLHLHVVPRWEGDDLKLPWSA